MSWGHPHRGQIVLFAGDILLTASTILFVFRWIPETPFNSASNITGLTLFVLTFLADFYIFDLYNLQALNGTRTIYRLVAACGLGTLLLATVFSFVPWLGTRRGGLMLSGPILATVAYVWRRIYGHTTHVFTRREPVLVIGSSEDADTVRKVTGFANSRYELVGFLRQEKNLSVHTDIPTPADGEPVESATSASFFSGASRGGTATAFAAAKMLTSHDLEIEATSGTTGFLGLATAASLESTVAEHAVQSLVVRSESVSPELASAITRLRFAGVRVFLLPEFYMRLCEELPLVFVNDSWLSFAEGFDLLQARLFRKVKRLTDLVMAAAGLVISAPVIVLAALAIKLDSRGPVLFRQRRVGWMGRPFELVKLRSMCVDAERDGRPQWATEDDPRVTRVGRILRKLRLDELPQVVNVLHGEMSFIGPRPERPAFVEQLSSTIPFYHLRHYVPPGITGWAQVKYPYGASVEDARRKLQLDLYYICNASPLLDLRILLRTARVILFRHGSR